jgi:hypothetical protein
MAAKIQINPDIRSQLFVSQLPIPFPLAACDPSRGMLKRREGP